MLVKDEKSWLPIVGDIPIYHPTPKQKTKNDRGENHHIFLIGDIYIFKWLEFSRMLCIMSVACRVCHRCGGDCSGPLPLVVQKPGFKKMIQL